MNALIGYTGFVGGNLNRQHEFEGLYNSKNIEDIRGRSYDLVVCAGAPAEKWKANQNPVDDRTSIERLISSLRAVEVSTMILISTVDVFAQPIGVDEKSKVDESALSPYGRHRLQLERAARGSFSRLLIVRLPGLFGPGLKKNAIYDMMNRHQVERIDPGAVFQFYDVRHLWRDIEKSLRLEVDLIHISSEPVAIDTVARQIFEIQLACEMSAEPARYDLRSLYSEHWGREDGYLYGRKQVMKEIRGFVASSTRNK